MWMLNWYHGGMLTCLREEGLEVEKTVLGRKELCQFLLDTLTEWRWRWALSPSAFSNCFHTFYNLSFAFFFTSCPPDSLLRHLLHYLFTPHLEPRSPWYASAQSHTDCFEKVGLLALLWCGRSRTFLINIRKDRHCLFFFSIDSDWWCFAGRLILSW